MARRRGLALLLAAALLLAGCGKKGFPATVQGVTISGAPKRVAVLSEHLAEAAVGMGYGGQIAGVCDGSQLPGLEDAQPVGTALLPDGAALAELKADLVLSTQPLPEGTVNCPVVVLAAPTTLEGLSGFYRDIAACFAGERAEEGRLFAADAESWVAALNEKIGDADRPSFAVLCDPRGYLAGTGTLEADLFGRLLGENTAAAAEGYATLEGMAEPEVLFCTDALTLEELQRLPGFAEMACVQEGRVVFLQMAPFERCSSALFLQLIPAVTAQYPQVFGGAN
ncbi:ABC transporter substrate-binding protein [Bittarella massiliensis (ex Durand et al. 2017)]|uniref:ABC transporter substrate-binding protein n=1 Tax=Bittarella massiliensis (ex Durand et al. 2017) TaxID=1720313 RepID=UPI00073E8DAA|nr:ABC transporter substrate-binding protein [Bittarella massiliensis (ex Durand et al. 2017)]